jgi:hypothetical protein
MGNPRVKVLAATFAMLTLASISLIINEENVSANAWALLALAGVFAAATVMAFFQKDEGLSHIESDSIVSAQDRETETQALPNPVEDGFDVPVI